MNSSGLRKPSNIVPRRALNVFFARFAAIALPAAIMDDNRARISLASCRTHRVRAKYLRWVHWLECTFLHKHILPGTLAFFNSPPLHRLVGSYLLLPSLDVSLRCLTARKSW